MFGYFAYVVAIIWFFSFTVAAGFLFKNRNLKVFVDATYASIVLSFFCLVIFIAAAIAEFIFRIMS